jgi:dTDP-4-dehydrorhamnose 3,5-epimerase
MIFTETKLNGAFIVELEKFEDERGFFAMSWSESEFAALGLNSRLRECNVSFNHKKGTLRGMHYQRAPHGQVKLVRCTRGSVFDVIIDLRPESGTFKQWFGVELTAANHLALYVPKDFAHGFQTLEDSSELLYQMSDPYEPAAGAGLRWNDPAFAIEWPDDNRIINTRDAAYPDFAE